jgi:peptidoglycan/xylan/chitin deacetylase (PgdA/CDA1 family)
VNLLTRRVATTLLRVPAVNRAARVLARRRGHALVLVYHRVGTPRRDAGQVLPGLPVDVFSAQLRALQKVVDLVTLDDVLAHDESRQTPGDRQRPAVAVTFDDDLPSHVEHALPVLQELGVPAAFFLSGRALHGLGAYWFQDLAALILAYGEQRAAAMLRVPEYPEGLMLAAERNQDLRRRVSEMAAEISVRDILPREGIAALVAANMTIGFHTLAHDTLPELDDRMLEDAVSRGMEELTSIAGVKPKYFAYPHGKVDARSATAVQRAGFEAAFTGRPDAIRARDDRYRLGRWEPGPVGVDDLLVKMATRLHRTGHSRQPSL